MSAAAGATAGEVLAQRDGAVLTLTLNRPERLNALNRPLLVALIEQLEAIDASTRAVVLRGAGRAFSSGHDLKDAGQAGDEPYTRIDARETAELMQAVTRALRRCPLPVIAAVHGYAIGGGAEIAFSCDLVLAAEPTVFQFTETAVGLTITNSSSRTLPATAGPFVAKQLVLLGERFGAEQAREHGLVNWVGSEAALELELRRTVGTIEGRAPLAIAAAKRLLNAGTDGGAEEAMAREVAEAVELEMTADSREATRAFGEGRDPEFKGE